MMSQKYTGWHAKGVQHYLRKLDAPQEILRAVQASLKSQTYSQAPQTENWSVNTELLVNNLQKVSDWEANDRPAAW